MNSHKPARLLSKTITKRSLFPWFLLALACANGLLVYRTSQIWNLSEWTSASSSASSKDGRGDGAMDRPRLLGPGPNVPMEDVNLEDMDKNVIPPRSSNLSTTTGTTDHQRHNPSTAIQNNVSFCLLIKDDNDILNEWIAYHYHLWNLRQLIVAVDPSSQTSPRKVLQAWQMEFGLSFQIWEDARYMPDFFLQGQYDLVPRMIKFEDKNATKWQDSSEQSNQELQRKLIEINNHRYRQSKFLQHCAKAIQGTSTNTNTNMRQRNNNNFSPMSSLWMTHIDTDEYIALNPVLAHQPHLPIPIPTKPTSGSLLRFLRRVVRHDPDVVNWPCISMPRILYGSIEDNTTTISSSSTTTTTTTNLDAVWNLQRFETLRWKYHADFDKRDLNKQPKVIMDVSAFPPFNVSRKAFSIHRPSLHLCRMQAQMNVYNGKKYPLVVHHYLGSLERYLSRHDPRRTLALYHQKADIRDAKNEDGWIDGWLAEFVALHGLDKVTTVLSQYRATTENGPLTRPNPPPPPPPVEVPPQQQQQQQPNLEPSKEDESFPNKPKALGKILPLEEDSLSACLLVKDDNDILSEWIAYHHHVLKLRTLIVAVDPSSKTSPSTILQRWHSLMDDVQLWSDQDYMPRFFLKGNYHLVPNLVGNMTSNASTAASSSSWGDEVYEAQVREDLIEINNHRYRQVSFLSKCIRYLKERNKTWMIHIDTDEYVTLHPQVRNQEHWRQLTLNPTIQQFILLRLLKDAARDYSKGLSYPCVSMPRLLYGSKEAPTTNTTDVAAPQRFSKLPLGFNGTKFETLRWKYHSNYDADLALNGKPKAILDLSGLPPEALLLKDRIYSIHRPGLHLCKSDRKIRFDAPHRFPLTINHYIGSWERYNHREDARRSRSVYDVKAQVNVGPDDDWIDGWIPSFVQEHGLARARELLAEYTTDEYVEEIKATNITHVTVKNEERNMSSTSSVEFSACLLVKDDNDILNEWIAYHYHVLGLRNMIVAVDAKSHTSPSTLLDKWRQFGMQIEEWKDEVFMPDIYFQKAYHLQPRLVKIKKNKEKWLEGVEDQQVKVDYYNAIQDHRFRQITFVASCIKKLREQGRTWMIHIDTDEYVVVNPLLRQGKTSDKAFPIPATAQASVIPRLLNEYTTTTNNNSPRLNYPCISLPRLLYGSTEDPNVTKTIPRGYNYSRFETLRWKYHADYEDSSLNKQPKVIMNVAGIPDNDKMFVENRVFSIHRPSQALCRPEGEMFMTNTQDFPLVVNHYLGTFERFSARDDLRRNRKLYDQKASVQAGKDEDQWVDSWLAEFIAIHGEDTVSNLLQDYRSDAI